MIRTSFDLHLQCTNDSNLAGEEGCISGCVRAHAILTFCPQRLCRTCFTSTSSFRSQGTMGDPSNPSTSSCSKVSCSTSRQGSRDAASLTVLGDHRKARCSSINRARTPFQCRFPEQRTRCEKSTRTFERSFNSRQRSSSFSQHARPHSEITRTFRQACPEIERRPHAHTFFVHDCVRNGVSSRIGRRRSLA